MTSGVISVAIAALLLAPVAHAQAPVFVLAKGSNETAEPGPTLTETISLPAGSVLTIDAYGLARGQVPDGGGDARIITRVAIDGVTCSENRSGDSDTANILFRASGSCTRFLESGEHTLTVQRIDQNVNESFFLRYDYLAVLARDLSSNASPVEPDELLGNIFRDPGVVLSTVDASISTEGDEITTVDLAAVGGFATHLDAMSRCAVLGNNGFADVFYDIRDSNGGILRTYNGCRMAGVSNSESVRFDDDKVYALPVGARFVDIRLNLRDLNDANPSIAGSTLEIVGRPRNP